MYLFGLRSRLLHFLQRSADQGFLAPQRLQILMRNVCSRASFSFSGSLMGMTATLRWRAQLSPRPLANILFYPKTLSPSGSNYARERMYDPLELAEVVARDVVRERDAVEERKYYRFRGGRWYGGIATADCVGCNLRCRFCWSWRVRDNYKRVGRFYPPERVSNSLKSIASKRGYRLVRISGGEPTLSWKHLLAVIEAVEEEGLYFVLETNGILIGARKEYARDLSRFDRVHVRVSLKGASGEEFSMLTGARPEGFELQLRALEHLVESGVSCNPAVMLSFSEEESVERLLRRLAEIDRALLEEFEPEYVILYMHVRELLKRYGLKPRRYFTPFDYPSEFV